MLICDLERRRTISLLPDREPAAAQAWLAAQPQIEVVMRDRGGGYALAASRALPRGDAGGRPMENASQAFLAVTRGSMRQIRAKLEIAAIDPELLTAAERLQYEGYLRREDVNASVLALRDSGVAIKEIVRRTGHSRGTVRRVLRGERSEVFRSRRARSTSTCPRWTRAGKRASAVARLCGVRCAARASGIRCGWWASGPPAAGAQMRRTLSA